MTTRSDSHPAAAPTFFSDEFAKKATQQLPPHFDSNQSESTRNRPIIAHDFDALQYQLIWIFKNNSFKYLLNLIKNFNKI